MRAPDVSEEEGLRPIGALVAIAAGLPTIVALIAAASDPRQSLIPITLATGLSAVMAGIALLIRLRSARDDIRRLEAKLEAENDKRWESEEAIAADAAILTPPPPLPVATVSHEMRTPLHGMLGVADLLLETSLTPEQQSYAGAIRSSASSLSRLVDDLLDYSRIEAGRFLLEPAPTRIEPLLEQIAELMAPRAFAKGIGLATRIDPELPVAIVDEARLRQILINLVGNAISFTETGAVVLSAMLQAGSSDGLALIRFAITDSGPGVAEADRTRIFGEFERASTLQGGAGLGLAISQRIVQRMGGTIEVDSPAEGGSVFRFDLVLPRRNGVGDAGRDRLAGRALLLVAKPMLETAALIETLAAAGARVRQVETEEAAATLLATAAASDTPYELLLLDAAEGSTAGKTPGSVLAQLRTAAGRDIPAVLLIEPRRRKDVEAFRAEGVDAYLIRPMRRNSLLRVVTELLEGERAFRADPADRVGERTAPRPASTALRVLVAEDDPVSALLVRAVLEKLGHQVLDVASAPAAMQAITAERFDLALVDIQLAEDDGLAVIAGLRKAPGNRLGIIALSGMTDIEVKLAAERAGADLFLEKPVSPDVLRRAVEAVAGRRAA